MKGYYNRLVEAKEKYGDREVAFDGKKTVRYSDLLSAVDAYGNLLSDMGVKPGDKVTLLSYNSCDWLCAYFGITCYGAIAILMNYSLPDIEIASLREDMDSEVLFYGPYKGREKDAGSPAFLQPDPAKRRNIAELMIPSKTEFSYRDYAEEKYGAPAFVVFTSGSTGKPKGALLSERSNITGADAYVEALPSIEGETLLMGVPLFHIFGMGLAMAHLLHGGKLILPDVFSSENLIGFTDQCQVDAITAVMTVIVRMMEDPDFPAGGYPFVRRIYTGGAPLLPIQLMRVEKGFGNAVLLNSYGQTESDTGIAMTREEDSPEKRVFTVGKPLPHRKVVIMDANGAPCPTGEVGEVTILGEGNVMCGYYNLPPENQSIDENGVLHTADIGFLDEDGYLHLAGRIKDIIIKGGENIIPGEIEAEINAIDGVREVKVIGAFDELYGENVQACLTLQPGSTLTETQIREALTGRISRFRMPVNFFIFDEFPLKANGKLDACELARRMLRRLDERKVVQDLVNGIEVCSIRLRSLDFVINPVLKAVPEIYKSCGISENLSRRIMLCTEELLVERTGKQYLGSGSLCLEIRLWPDFLRLSFTDDLPTVPFEDAEKDEFRRIGGLLVSHNADRISVERVEGNRVRYSMDFVFDRDFSPKAILLG